MNRLSKQLFNYGPINVAEKWLFNHQNV